MTDQPNSCPTYAGLFRENYIQQAIRTEPPRGVPHLAGTERLLHAGMGLCTESGEFMDGLKKHLFYGKPLDEVNLIEELGDLFWYMAIAANELGVPFERIQEINIAKLKARYPDKFCSDKAQNRDLNTERAVLEGTHISQERPVL